MKHLAILLLFICSITKTISQCEADFTVFADGMDYQFSNTSQVEAGDEITSQIWSFGDGTSSVNFSPNHTYLAPGTYNVVLQIATLNGCNDSDTSVVEVCDLSLDFILGSVCNQESMVALTLSIDDVFNTVADVFVLIDDIKISDNPISIEQTLNLNLLIPGDGNQHFITVQSALGNFCTESISFITQDCNTSCFMADMQIDDGYHDTHNIVLMNNMFLPSNRIIELGDRVRFIWLEDNHSTTSVDTFSSDKWDSGIQDSSFVYEIVPKFPGLKPYYSIPESDVMTGNIIANCPTTLGNVINITFTNAAVPPSGFYLAIDGVTLYNQVYAYGIDGFTSVEFFLPGDGLNHQIAVIDIAEPECTIKKNVKAISCQGSLPCALNINAAITQKCDIDSMVTIALSINSLAPSENGVQIMVDDTLVMDTIYFTNNLALTSILLPGDGLIHVIEAIDLMDTTCRDQFQILVSDCSEPCGMNNLEIGTGSNNTVVLGITNNQISLKNIGISSGDDILWQWVEDSIVGVRSFDTTSINSWDSGLLGRGAIYISPILTAGLHPYYLYNTSGDTLFIASVEVIANCENNQVAVFYNFNDTNGSLNGYDIYVDDVKISSNPFPYALNGANKGVFTIQGDDMEHEIEFRDNESDDCSTSGIFVAPSCEIPPCGGTVEVTLLDSCYNDNTVAFIAQISHPNPSALGFIFRIDDVLFPGFPFLYGENGISYFEGFLPADNANHVFTYVDLLDQDCVDTTSVITPTCITDCNLTLLSSDIIDSTLAITYPSIADSMIGCQDSFAYVYIRFTETYSDSDGFIVYLDSNLVENNYLYNAGDTINELIMSVIGDESEHSITIVDKVNSMCMLTTYITTPLCYSPCHIEISEITIDSCVEEIGYYTLNLAANTNSIGFGAIVDGDTIFGGIDTSFSFTSIGDGLTHYVKLIDQLEPTCTDSFSFTGTYCLDCPLALDIIQIDSCIIGDSMTYAIVFDSRLDSGEVYMHLLDSTYFLKPQDFGYQFQFRVRGDSLAYTIDVTSAEDAFCTASISFLTPDCTPIICDAQFSYSIDGLTVTFTDSSITSEPIINQSWVINDIISIGNLASFSYTVDSIGTYTICHTIVSDSCSTTLCRDIMVGDPCTQITPLFSVERIGEGFQFSNLSTGNIDQYLYRFGDGIFSNSTDPYHIYDEPGTYEACLIVRQVEFDCELEYCEFVEVSVATVDLDMADDIIIYPNPLDTRSSLLFIDSPSWTSSTIVSVTIHDINGLKIELSNIEKTGNNKTAIHLPTQVTPGNYILTVNDGFTVTKKVLVITN